MPNRSAQQSISTETSSTNSGGHVAFTLYPSLRHTREQRAVGLMVSESAARALEATLHDTQTRVLPRLHLSSRRALTPAISALELAVRARDARALHTAVAEGELALYALIRGVIGADIAAENELSALKLVFEQARALTRRD